MKPSRNFAFFVVPFVLIPNPKPLNPNFLLLQANG